LREGEFDPDQILRTLNAHSVRYVVIGGLAGNLRGTPDITYDVDICYARDRDNLERLASALEALGAKLRVANEAEDLPFQLDARTIVLGDSFTFRTTAGPLDILATPSGTNGFADLDAGATDLEVGEGLVVRVASVDDLIRMKRASARTKDRMHLEHLGPLREEIEAARAAGEDPHQG
jgi:hypothetical protein